MVRGVYVPAGCQAVDVPVRWNPGWGSSTLLPTHLSLLGIAHIFDGVINSSDVGAAKPDPIIFHRALSIADATAKRALFIDDSLPNVEAARELGIRSLHFQGEGELGSFLRGA